MNFKLIKEIFIHYLLAFFIGRIPGRILAMLQDKAGFDLFGWLRGYNHTLYFYTIIVFSFVLWAGFATLLWSSFRKEKYDFALAIMWSILFILTGVPIVLAGMQGTIPPQLMLLALPVQFLLGLLIAAWRASKV